MRTYQPVDGAAPRLVPVSPLRAVAEIGPVARRVAVLVPGSVADQVAAALNTAYQNGRQDLAGDVDALLGPPLLIDQFTAEQVELIVRTAAELWYYNCEPDIMSEAQRDVLDLAATVWWDDHAADMRAQG